MRPEALPAVLDSLPEPVFLLSTRGEVLMANEAAVRLHGAGGALIGANLAEIAAGPADRLLAYLRRCSGTAESLPGTIALPLSDGRVVRYRCRGALVGRDGDGPAIVLLRCERHDLSQFKALTDKITELHDELRRHRRTQRRLEEALADKEALVRELHHRVRNNFQLMLGILVFSEREEGDGQARERLRAVRLRAEAIAVAQRLLYGSESFAALNAATLLEELCGNIAASLGLPRTSLQVEAEPAAIDLEVALSLGLLVNELVTALLARPFPGGQPPVIRVTLRADGFGYRLDVAIDDRGGCVEATAGTRREPKLALALARQLGGSCRMDRADGLRWVVQFADGSRNCTAQGKVRP